MKRMFFIVVGFVIVLSAIIWGVRTYKFISQSSSVQGEVIRLNAGSSHPEIKFITQDGKKIEYPQGGLIFGYKVGDKVEVLYNAKNPNNASINSFGALWGFVILFFILGLIFLTVGFYQMFFN